MTNENLSFSHYRGYVVTSTESLRLIYLKESTYNRAGQIDGPLLRTSQL